ncbi:MAG: YraN family protein [Pseudomonadota bacterium]
MQLSLNLEIPTDTGATAPLVLPAAASQRRRSAGKMRHYGGAAAEDIAVRAYEGRGLTVLERRYKTSDGELDLVLLDDEQLVFVEVKRCKRRSAWDSPVSPTQWRRLERAAQHYLASYATETGAHPFCRFDVALVNELGAAEIVENAMTFGA